MSALDAALQSALAAEHQAVFGYSLLGPQLSAADQGAAAADAGAHEQLRDDTEVTLRSAGQDPVAPLVDYPALYPVHGATAAQRLAVALEDDCASAWRFAYLRAASTSSSDTAGRRVRTTSQAALTASAVRGTRWRALLEPTRATTPFPGIG